MQNVRFAPIPDIYRLRSAFDPLWTLGTYRTLGTIAKTRRLASAARAGCCILVPRESSLGWLDKAV
jgi:hypothetical protein